MQDGQKENNNKINDFLKCLLIDQPGECSSNISKTSGCRIASAAFFCLNAGKKRTTSTESVKKKKKKSLLDQILLHPLSLVGHVSALRLVLVFKRSFLIPWLLKDELMTVTRRGRGLIHSRDSLP